MNNKKTIKYGGITLVTFIGTRTILNIIGINNIPVNIYIALIIAALIIYFLGVIKSKAVGFMKIYNAIFSFFMLVNCSLIVLSLVLEKYFSYMFESYKDILKIVILTAFVLFGVTVLLLRIIYERKYKD